MADDTSIQAARAEFERARFRADVYMAIARLTGRPIELLDFEEVRQKLHAVPTGRRELKDIPIAAIAGSVGRRSNYIRGFLPRGDDGLARWIQVEQGLLSLEGLPPIEVFQIGDAYFVLDGHHRVSVARQMGLTHIEAYVAEMVTRTPLTTGADQNEVVLKARYLEFLLRTGLDDLRPGSQVFATWPGAYDLLERHIAVHRRVLEASGARDVTDAEAVTDWYDQIYAPITQLIREQNLLRDYPGLSEADLYLWVSGYRALTDDMLDWEFNDDQRADHETAGKPRLGRALRRALDRARSDAEVLPGEWRRRQMIGRGEDIPGESLRLFTSILVPVSGRESSWAAVSQALKVAGSEQGRLLGLHVVPNDAARGSAEAQDLATEFDRRCAEAGVLGKLGYATGDVANTVCERSRWADMTALGLSYPPPGGAWGRWRSGLTTLIGCCRSPLLVVPAHGVRDLRRAVLAYNGSPRSRQALFVAVYIALRWRVDLTVVSVGEATTDAGATLREAENYLLAQGVSKANFVEASGTPADAVLQAAIDDNANLLLLGGYSVARAVKMPHHSVVDEVLRSAGMPVLICPQAPLEV